MSEYSITVVWGLTSRKISIEGWKTGEWTEATDGSKKRIVEDTTGQRYIDYEYKDGKHKLVKQISAQEKQKKEEKVIQKEKDKEDSPEKKLFDFIKSEGMEFYKDQFANNCVIYKNKYYELNGSEIKARISSLYFQNNDAVFNDATWNKVVNILSNECLLNERYFPLRCHTDTDAIYYDTGKEVWLFINGKAIQLDSTATHTLPFVFRRYNHQKIAELKETDKTAKELLQEVIDLFNIEDFRPESIIPMFSSEHPNPMGLISGDPGSAKSTFMTFLKRLVDPDQVEKLSMPDKKNLAEFGLHRQRFYVIAYDNIRSISQEQSDELCRMITGGTSATRRLYTNGEIYVMKGLPRILGNGLRPEPSSFNDLLDRTLLFDMFRIKHSKPEIVIWKKINDLMPEIRYACLRDMSAAIVLAYEQEFPKMPRMSEYCLLGESLNVLWGGQLGDFVNWFNKKMSIAHGSGMDDSLAVVLIGYLQENKSYLTEGINCTASEWRLKLLDWANEKYETEVSYGKAVYKELRPNMATLVKEEGFPKNANWLGRRFRDLSPLLNELGYEINVIRTSEENTIRIIQKNS